jgi:hypothetical protein
VTAIGTLLTLLDERFLAQRILDNNGRAADQPLVVRRVLDAGIPPSSSSTTNRELPENCERLRRTHELNFLLHSEGDVEEFVCTQSDQGAREYRTRLSHALFQFDP